MKSAVAGIIDNSGGGLRIVVTPYWRMRFHVQEGERIFILPGRIQEPIDWDDCADLVTRVKEHIASNKESSIGITHHPA